MKQKYLYNLLIIGMLFFATPSVAQDSEQSDSKEVTIEGLSVYPNPTSGNVVYITTKEEKPKKIEIYNALGKVLLTTNLSGNELNITSLESGIYILKITEANRVATRKLVVR